MSRVGKLPVIVPDNIKVDINGKNIKFVSGTVEKNYTISKGVVAKLEGNAIKLSSEKDSQSKVSMFVGMNRSNIKNIVSGLSSEDRNIIGIYPLRGKLLNVRGESIKKITDNKEITDLKKILGLENGRTYSSIDDVNQHLRYGKIMIMLEHYHGEQKIKLCYLIWINWLYFLKKKKYMMLFLF